MSKYAAAIPVFSHATREALIREQQLNATGDMTFPRICSDRNPQTRSLQSG